MEKQIAGLLKQNQSIHGSLITRSISDLPELVVLTESMSLDEQKNSLMEENVKLKAIVLANKPVELPKEPKPVPTPSQSKPKPKPKLEDINEVSDEEDNIEVQPKFTTITNMEDIKRAFFSGDYELFNTLVTTHPFKMYTGEYLYASDKDGAPDYSARNLVGGFVRTFDDYRKYFMICFRCYQHLLNDGTVYTYPSFWIVNSNDSINTIIGSTAEDYKLSEVTPEQVTGFLKSLEKLDVEKYPELIVENYVH